MKTYFECIPCFFRQAIETVNMLHLSEAKKHNVINEIAQKIQFFPKHKSPPEFARIMYKVIKEHSKVADPFKHRKHYSNVTALKVYDHLKRKVSHSKGSLLTAVELAAIGNVIDYGIKSTLNVEKEINKILTKETKFVKNNKKAVFDFKEFEHTLKKAKNILYIGDNAGETVFDRILIEYIKAHYPIKNVFYAVKKSPIINDATLEDAVFCGLDKSCQIISSGSDAPGTILKLCDPNFLKVYRKADMVISKGQGNFETLSHAMKPIFFLFMAKCDVIVKNVSKTHGFCDLGNINLIYNAKHKIQ
ncbi:DUF89 domain-containing protein [bacterium]